MTNEKTTKFNAMNLHVNCPLCGTSCDKAKPLYGHDVCQKCCYGFAVRRHAAFFIDLCLGFGFLLPLVYTTCILTHCEISYFRMFVLVFVLFTLKDGFAGYSPGKAMMGVRVIDENSGRPILFLSSFLRNLPMILICLLLSLLLAFMIAAHMIRGIGIPLAPLAFFICGIAVEGVRLCKGFRAGDRRAKTKVIWKRYREHPVFLHKSSPHFVWTDAMKEEAAEEALSKAVKLEAKRKCEEAAAQYEAIIADYPNTNAAKDSSISLDSLNKRFNRFEINSK